MSREENRPEKTVIIKFNCNFCGNSAKTRCKYFSVVDVIAVLTDSSNPTDYLKKMRKRDEQLANYLGTNCPQVAMMGATGKKRKVLAATAEQLLRIIQSIPSPKAEPFKLWLAQVGRERIEETIDPEQAIDRALETYQKKDMIQTGFISGSFLSVPVMSLPRNGRSEAYSKAKSMLFSQMRSRKPGPA